MHFVIVGIRTHDICLSQSNCRKVAPNRNFLAVDFEAVEAEWAEWAVRARSAHFGKKIPGVAKKFTHFRITTLSRSILSKK